MVMVLWSPRPWDLGTLIFCFGKAYNKNTPMAMDLNGNIKLCICVQDNDLFSDD
jgi:hypothetical protein